MNSEELRRVKKSPLIPNDAAQGYFRDLERLIEMKAVIIEDDVNDDLDGLNIERNFLKMVTSH